VEQVIILFGEITGREVVDFRRILGKISRRNDKNHVAILVIVPTGGEEVNLPVVVVKNTRRRVRRAADGTLDDKLI
jgi:hypothetical protein